MAVIPEALLTRAFILGEDDYGWLREDACEVTRWLASAGYVISGGESWLLSDIYGPLGPIPSDPAKPDRCNFWWHWDFDPSYDRQSGSDVERSLTRALGALADAEVRVEGEADPAVRSRIRYNLTWRRSIETPVKAAGTD